MTMHLKSIPEACEVVKILAKMSTNFKTQLTQLEDTLESIQHVTSNNKTASDTELIALILEAEKLVRKCPKIRWNLFKKLSHRRKLKDINDKLLYIRLNELLVQTHVQEPETRSVSESSAPSTVKTEASSLQRGKWGWRLTRLPKAILTFDQPLKKLKYRVLFPHYNLDDFSFNVNTDYDLDCWVVVVSAPAGSGKTILVNILCNDPEIEDKYRDNIFYVTVPEKPNFMVMVNDLLNPNHLIHQPMVQNNKEAKDKLEKFLHERAAYGPILLVLDGVQSDVFIKNFEFKIKGYKILVTSEMIFPKYDVFILDPLSDDDAKALFKLSAFDEFLIPGLTIDDDLVNQMVKCCKKHPLTLSVVGNSLYGKSAFVWRSVIKTWSQDELVLDNKDRRIRLERTIEQLDMEFMNRLLEFEALHKKFKQCLLDLALFPRNQRISACALLDIWVTLYSHDDMGKDTLRKIFQLADRNLVHSISIGEEANAIVNYCKDTFITQQDLQRELAIHCSSKKPISQRTRLIIEAQGSELNAPIQQVNEVMSARMLSISTGESFSSRWCNMNVPNVEVMVLNIMSETYNLPGFLRKMQNLKVMNVTNFGLHPTEFTNFHLLGRLTSLTRIRLERVTISFLDIHILLPLVNLQKVSLTMCKTSNGLENLSTDMPDAWPTLFEIEIESCQDLVGFPQLFCNSVYLQKLSITNCNEMIQIPEEFDKLTSLETLSLRSCKKLEKLPDSISRLKKLSILDISDCLSLSALPEYIGDLSGLQMIYMKGCIGIHQLPPSVKDLSQLQVLCNEEISYKWHEFTNVKIPVVEEDRLFTLIENMSK